ECLLFFLGGQGITVCDVVHDAAENIEEPHRFLEIARQKTQRERKVRPLAEDRRAASQFFWQFDAHDERSTASSQITFPAESSMRRLQYPVRSSLVPLQMTVTPNSSTAARASASIAADETSDSASSTLGLCAMARAKAVISWRGEGRSHTS